MPLTRFNSSNHPASLLSVICLSAGLLAGCSSGSNVTAPTGDGDNGPGGDGDGDAIPGGTGGTLGTGGTGSPSGGGTGGTAANTGGDMNNGTGGSGGLTSGELLLHATFAGRSPGQYSAEMVEGDFGAPATWNNGLDDGHATIVDDGDGPFLRVTYQANEYGPAGGVQFKPELSAGHSELYLAYRVRFGSGFDFVKGGKLPGLVGGSAPTGCIDKSDPDSYNGLSARMMWRTEGRAVQYVYTPDRVNDCGDDYGYEPGGVEAQFAPGTWHVVQHRIVLNTPGEPNGILQAWFDGVEAINDQAVVWRRSGATWQLDALYFSTFFGGGDSSWAPNTDQAVDFDDFVISTAPIQL